MDGLEIGQYTFSILIIDKNGNDLTDDVGVLVLLGETEEDTDDDEFNILTYTGLVNTDLSSIEENPRDFAIFSSILSIIVVGTYLIRRRRKLKAKKTPSTKKKSSSKKKKGKK